MPPAPRSTQPPASRRLVLLAVSAVLAAIGVMALTILDSSAPSVEGLDTITASAMDLARYKDLRASLIPRATKGFPRDPGARQTMLTSYMEALDVATSMAHRAGVVVPSDTLLIILTSSVRRGLTPEGAEALLHPISSSSRLARVSAYDSLVAHGETPASAVAKATRAR